jgi:colanic acid/amylovoran biosynthesis glycosyltransferase
MRILVVTGGFPLRSETFVREQCTGLVEAGHEVEILALRPGDGTWSPRDLAAGLPGRTRPVRLDRPAIARLLASGRAIVRRPGLVAALAPNLGWRAVSGQLVEAAGALGPRRAFDAIHAQFGPSGRFIELARAAGVVDGPIATAFYGYDLTRELRRNGAGSYARLFRNGSLFLPNSDFLAGLLRQAGAPADRIVTHHLGIDLAGFPARERPPRPDPTFLAVGRLVEKKGFEFLVRAVAHAGPGFRGQVRIAGDGPLGEGLRGLARELGVADRVSFTGWASPDEVARAMHEADVLVMPSVTAADGDMEGLPVVLSEAMATGLPVIGTRHSGIPEAVRDGENGRVVPERDVAALASALVEFSDPAVRAALAARSRAIAEAEFDGSRLAPRLASLLAEMAKV